MSDLNPPQRSAIEHFSSPLLVLAGAGSGKTRVITRKIAHLIRRVQISPKNIIAVTFTNKAAREMQSRVAELLEGTEIEGLTVSTFHTLGLKILRTECAYLDYKPNLSIYDNEDTIAVLRHLLDATLPDKDYLRRLQQAISHFKNGFISPEQALSMATHELEHQIAKHYAAYQTQLHAYNAVDFDDLIMLPVQIFERYPDVLQSYQNRVRHLLVDEYQDTNVTQYRFLKLLVGQHCNFTVVGDDDQSIYAFRGAQPENMRLLKQDFPLLRVIKLEQNYRSSSRILRLANALIGNNPHVFDKNLWSDKDSGDIARVLAVDNDNAECEKVVTDILNHYHRYGTRYSDYAVLYRNNYQAKAFELALRTRNIPYYVSGGMSFFSRSEIKDLIAYLRLIANPADDTAFLRVVNLPARGIGSVTLKKLSEYATLRGLSLLGACRDYQNLSSVLSPRFAQPLSEFAEYIDLFHRSVFIHGISPNVIAKTILEDIDYEAYLTKISDNAIVAAAKWQYVQDLLDWFDQLINTGYETLESLVTHIMLLDVEERQDANSKYAGVALMTFHAAKGLEFPHVYMVGMEEDLLPFGRNAQTQQGIQEERRLAYVGITRAQKSITFTLADKRKRFGKLDGCDPSRFLQELPQEDLEWEGRINPFLFLKMQQSKQVRAIAHMQYLKSIKRA